MVEGDGVMTKVTALISRLLGKQETCHSKQISAEVSQQSPLIPSDQPQVGQVLKGVVLSVGVKKVKVKLPSGHNAHLKTKHISWDDKQTSGRGLFSVGSQIEVIVIRSKVNKQGRVLLQVGYRELHPDSLRAELDQRYLINSRHTATLVQFTPYGAFVKLASGLNALLHNSEISWIDRNINASDVFKLGDTIEVIVLAVDMVRKRLSVSYRLTQPNPWDLVQTDYPTNTQITGYVSKIVPFGVYVKLPNGCSGLVHKSQLPAAIPISSFAVGDTIGVSIVSCEPQRQRIALKLDPNQPESIKHIISNQTSVD